MTTAPAAPKTPSRVYLVAGPKGDRLVEATSKSQAVGHCARGDYSCEVASQKALIAAMQAGTKVERAGVTIPTIEDF